MAMTEEISVFAIYDEVSKAADWLRHKYKVQSVHQLFEQEFNATIVYTDGKFPHHLIFKTPEDFTMFMLRWA